MHFFKLKNTKYLAYNEKNIKNRNINCIGSFHFSKATDTRVCVDMQIRSR